MYTWCGSVKIESHCAHCSTISPFAFATTTKFVRRNRPSRGTERSAGQSPRVTTMMRSAWSTATPATCPQPHSLSWSGATFHQPGTGS